MLLTTELAHSTKKRGISLVEDLVSSPSQKQSRIPVLASFGELAGIFGSDKAAKKRVLMTREKLRAATHDPKGLLSLVDSSTNALERTKRLELLKSAGVEFSSGKKYGRTFAEKIKAATFRLDLGLGGHSSGDALCFGAKVLSIPRFLTFKHISDIENSVVDGNTTWRHQDAYAKTMIAGNINQSKRILERFDDILYGPAPESIIEDTHRVIHELLISDEGRSFLSRAESSDTADQEKCNDFIKRFIGAVRPILPITLRDKSLDGSYFRTALYMLGAAELLFTQYEADIRKLANPAGVVGMCSYMHSEFERNAFHNEDLEPLNDFMRDMTTQYQTSLGLGSSFPSDSSSRKNRTRNRYTRGQAYSRPGGFMGRGLGRGQQLMQSPFQVGGNGEGSPNSLRSRGECFAFQAGTCRRGNACRFMHLR